MARSVWVRATVNLQGISRGQVRKVDPDAPWVRDNLASGLLIRVNPAGVEITPKPEPAAEPEPAAVPDVGTAQAVVEPAADRGPDIPADEGAPDDEAETDAVAP